MSGTTIVSISNNNVVIGNNGKIYFYEYINGQWIQNSKFDKSNCSVSICENFAIIGSTSPYIYHKNGNFWTEYAKIVADDIKDDYYGAPSVSISNNYAIVGVKHLNNNTGAAYIFKRDGSKWIQNAKLTASDGKENDQFGNAVSITDNFAIVGAEKSNNNDGKAYIFSRDGNNWLQQHSLSKYTQYDNDYFGRSVSISDNYAVVGSKYGGYGNTYFYKLKDNRWTSNGSKNNSNYRDFGYSVSIFDDILIIGVLKNNLSTSGGVYKYFYNGDSWQYDSGVMASDASSGDNFGYDVSVSNNFFIVGSNKGSAYIYPVDTIVSNFSGYVTDLRGLPFSGAMISVNDLKTVTTNENGFYLINEPYYKRSGTITVSYKDYIFNQPVFSFEHQSVDMLEHNFSINVYTISGFVKDVKDQPIVDAKISFSNGGGSTFTNSQGYYTHDVYHNWSGDVQIQGKGYKYEPLIRYYENVNQNYFDEDYTASKFTISGYCLDKYQKPITCVEMTLTPTQNSCMTDSDGYYVLDANYKWSGKLYAKRTGYQFEPSFKEYRYLDTSFANENFQGILSKVFITGQILDGTNHPVENVVIDIGDNQTAFTTDSNGMYTVFTNSQWSGTIMPIKQGFNFIPPSRTYTQMIASKENQNYIGSNQQFNILGKIVDNQNAPMSGIKIHVDDIIYITDESGFIKLTLPYGWQGKIQPNRTGYGFEPQYYEISNLSENKSDMNFKAKLLTFKIAGQLTDNANQPVSNISILVNNGVGTTITDNNGYYQKDVPFGWSGMIIPQSTNVTFNPAFYAHMIVVQNIMNQNFTASRTPLPFEKPEWIVDETQFQYQQTITAIVNQSQNDWSIHDGDILAAFANTTCRGVSAPVETSQGKRFFLQIWSNQTNEKLPLNITILLIKKFI
ncbi:MAG: hypothetical protein OMM_04000 [Candidatus Magnetoglobus multicellularis str. Araruama]|uniref:PKD domain-containing protein n=1 Tax=Candidatus Magnetoglobus multicellularis str. Araruama TaxID=890399 RepID=A0A1V1P392_9BACT|nr:MAG: hypothetical protein OMM_04000 [Candidatus Magnetoglobus multicellularis str. Araruama]